MEVLKYTPTILMIGVGVLMLRRMSGGMGGGASHQAINQ